MENLEEILDDQWERAGPGGRQGIVLSDTLRGIFALGFYEWRVQTAIKWLTARRPLYTFQEVCEKTRLPTEVMARELALRGIQPK